MALVGEEVKPMLPTFADNMTNALQVDAAWWATHHAELRAAFEEWYAAGRGLSGTAR